MRRQLPMVACILLAAPCALADDLPTRKAGLWEMKMVFENRNVPQQSMQHCTDAATDKLMTSNLGNAGPQQCSKRETKVSGNTITMDSVCTVSGMTMTTHAIVSGDFNSAYTVKINSKREGGPAGAAGAGRENNMTVEAKWLGACKADQKPGDMVLPTGQTVNIIEMQRLQSPAGRGAPPRPGAPQPK